jgi:hypothetical protein
MRLAVVRSLPSGEGMLDEHRNRLRQGFMRAGCANPSLNFVGCGAFHIETCRMAASATPTTQVKPIAPKPDMQARQL